MYSPLVKALNLALDRLSEIKVHGLPDFEEKHQIVFVHTNARNVATEDYFQRQFKPDIALLQWKTFKKLEFEDIDGESPPFSETYSSDLCCKSGTTQPKFNWRNLLSTLEVKRGGNEVIISGFPNKLYTPGFGELSMGPTVDEPPTSLPLTRSVMAREIFPVDSGMSISPSTFARPLTHPSSAQRPPYKQGVHTLNL